jgi:pimeloyl-ACP methyl ester carboxylesterase
MKGSKRALKGVAIFLSILIVLVFIWWIWPERTSGIKGNNAVATIDYIRIGGLEQSILIRSHDTNNPILLFLHGGPGMPMMYLAHDFQRPLEEHFTAVHWDRRGAGKTYSRNMPSPESMNTRQLVDDAYTLIDTLRNRYDQDKIVLVGHSFGTHLGSIMVTERPELFSAYISIGQVVDDDRAIELQAKFIREQARLKERSDILGAIDTLDHRHYEDWIFELGGALQNNTSFFPLLRTGLQAPEYTMKEAMTIAKGSSFSSFHMKYNVLSGSIYDEIVVYEIPVYFFTGISDYTTPHELITEYYKRVRAPLKGIVYFEDSAHFPFFEEPEAFCGYVKRLLLDQK